MAKRGYESQKTGQKVDDLLDKIDNLNVPEWALQESKPSYTAQEVHALPENTSIPRKTSDLVNDRGFITQESDPTVPSWAKQPSKPGYTAQEVGALPSDTPLFSGDYNDLRNKPTIPTVPENVSAFNNDAGYLTNEDMGDYATKQELQGKQDTINDLASIRSGASAGATAYQKPESGIPENDLSQGVKDKMNEKDVFWATYGTTTAAEIDAAVAAGKVVMCYFLQHIYKLEDCRSDQPLYFSCFIASQARYFLTVNRTTSAWANNLVNHELSSYKVSSWSNTPNDTRYPSEKLVKDSLDTKAGIGDVLFANFSNLTPKKTFEYDVSDTAYHPLFSRANTGISQLMSEVDDIVKFRITVTGTNIYARVDVVVRFQPSLTYPVIMAWNDLANTSYSGLFNIRGIFPKARNSDYNFIVEFNCFNNTARHIKVEVYEDTENITWTESNTASSYNSTYQSNSGVLVYNNRGLCANQTWRFENAYTLISDHAGFLTTKLPAWVSGTIPLAGEALLNNQLIIVSNQKFFKVTNKVVPIDCDCGVMIMGASYSQNATVQYDMVTQKRNLGNLAADPALTYDTFARGDQVYLRCTLGQDGKIYPDGHLSNVKSAGYTWVHIGTAASATAINLDTCGKPFITLNNDGKVTHVNGIQVMDSSMSKWGVVSQTQTWTNDYGSYTLSDVTYGYIPKEFIDRWLILVDVFGTFNESTGYFELNGLTDLCYKDAIRIANNYTIALSTEGWRPNNASYLEREKFKARTTIPCSSVGGNVYPALTHNQYLEVVKFAFNDYTYSQIIFTSFVQYGCVRLRRLLDKVSTGSAITLTNWYALEECYFILKANLTASQSKYLSIESILYMINNVAVTTAITITLHPTAYARAIADSDVQAALQAHTNVSLASV